jgi:hypothetical protein
MELIMGRTFFFSTRGTCIGRCPLKYLLFVPIITMTEVFALKEIISLPFAKKGIVGESWKQVNIPYSRVVAGKNDIFNYDSFDCFHELVRNTRPCELCKFVARPSHDECVEAIVEQKPLRHKCDMRESDEEDVAMQIDRDDYLYADKTPGNVKEVCAEEERNIDLPKTGHVRFDPSCTYTFTDNTLRDMDIDDSELGMTRSASHSSDDHEKTHISVIEEHFEEHSMAYILTMIILFVITTLSSFAYAYMQKRQHRVITIRNQRSESPDVGQALVRFINRDRGV